MEAVTDALTGNGRTKGTMNLNYQCQLDDARAQWLPQRFSSAALANSN